MEVATARTARRDRVIKCSGWLFLREAWSLKRKRRDLRLRFRLQDIEPRVIVRASGLGVDSSLYRYCPITFFTAAFASLRTLNCTSVAARCNAGSASFAAG